MSKPYHPTREDHFSGHKGAERLKQWLEDHNLPISDEKGENLNTMIRATGGVARY